MRILLLCPKSNFPAVTPPWLRIPQLTLPILAALTPPEHEVLVAEEGYDPLPLDEHWDVAGISAMTATAPRAYELACVLRRNGAKVILGGIHPSVLPHEAAQFADAVVVGEAEGIWPQVLRDAQRNRLKRLYRNLQPDLSQSPLPLRATRRSLFGLPPYVMPVMASRGCPYDCEFCCVHRVYGRRQRHVPIERIIQDISSSGARQVMFLDDNIGGVRPYATRLFEALRPLKVRWSGQATVRFILDDQLFDAALRSGLVALFVGVESIEPEARDAMPKSLPSVQLYEKAMERCRRAGVVFHASLIFGLDEQTPHVFERTLEFLLRGSVPSISPCMLTPYPGTRLFQRLMRERRVLHTNWAYYNHMTVCYQPKGMDPEELTEKYLDFQDRFFSASSIIRRGLDQLRVAPLAYLGMNLAYHKGMRLQREHSRQYFRWLRQNRGAPTTAHRPQPAYSAWTPIPSSSP